MASAGVYAVAAVTAPSAQAATGTVTGVVFQDYNQNGVKDAGNTQSGVAGNTSATDRGIEGVQVTVTWSGGSATGLTNSSGAYSIAVNTGTEAGVRIEFATPTGFTSGPRGTGSGTVSGTAVQFGTVSGSPLVANYGIVRQGDYSQDSPRVLVGQAMAALGTSTSGAGAMFTDAVRQTQASLTSSAFTSRGLEAPRTEATQYQTGSIWGVTAIDADYGLSAAVFKRHARLGGNGVAPGNALGQIYLTAVGGDPDATPWVTIPNAGTNPRLVGGITSESQLQATNTSTGNDWFHDVLAYPQAGKIGLGGITTAPDRRSIYVVNLNDKNLYQVPFTRGGTGAPVAGTPVAIPLPITLPGATATCPAADVRPYGVSAEYGALWVTLTCSVTPLTGYVYRYDIAAGTFSKALEFGLSGHNRGATYSNLPSAWQAWTGTWQSNTSNNKNQGAAYPQPLLADIGFDSNGDMTIGIKDRFSDQIGYQAGNLTPNSTGTYEGFAGGDLLRACVVGGSYQLESGGRCGSRTGSHTSNNQGPGGGEFYSDDFTSTHNQVALGGVLQIPGYAQVLATTYDPGTEVRSQGYRFFNNSNGGWTSAGGYHTLQGIVNDNGTGAQGSFSKGGGMGDLAALTGVPPQQIGNRVWLDTNRNGIQDPNEPAIAGVTVELLAADGVTVLATTTTDAKGEYYFDSATTAALTPNTDFVVRIPASNFAAGGPLNGLLASMTAQGDNEGIDSNGVPTGDVVLATVTTGDAGVDDHTIDFGFHTPVYAVGDVVWYDTDRDGVQDAGEQPVVGLTVTLTDAAGNPAIDGHGNPVPATTTDADGHYVFDNLPAGEYRVVFGTLDGYALTTQHAGTTQDDSDPDPVTRTAAVTLGPISGTLPQMSEVDPADGVTKASAIDRTIDAGFVRIRYAVGDVVWNDTNRNGVQDGGETPRAGITVTLYAADGTTPAVDLDGNPVAPVTTDAAGRYLFQNLPAGDYRIAFGALPAGYVWTGQGAGTTATDSNPDQNGLTPVFTLGLPSGSLPEMRAVTGADNTTAADHINPTIDAGLYLGDAYAVGDKVWYDDNGNGIQDPGETTGVPGVLVTLLDGDGNPATHLTGEPVAPVPTDAAGHYVFDNLAPGTYQITFSELPTGTVLTGTSVDGSTLANDSNPVVTTGTTPPFQVGPTAPGNRVPVESDGTTAAVGINPTIDAGITAVLAVGDVVWYDTNKNGLQDGTETGVAGVTVTLLTATGGPVTDASGNTVAPVTTDADGRYVFDNLRPGSYRVQFSDLPTGYQLTTQQAGDVAADSDPATDTGLTPVFDLVRTSPELRLVTAEDGTLVAGFINPTIDAGIHLSDAYAVGDFVWYDVNGNGVQDAGEAPVAGMTVTLLNADGTPAADLLGNPVAPVTTDAAGHYVFDNLAAGEYRVQFGTPPTGWSFTTTDTGADDAADSDANSTGRTGVIVLGPGRGETPVAGDGVTAAVLIDRTVDAGLVAPVAIGDVVWYDSDKDGIQGAEELPVAGVTVTLYLADGVTPATDITGAPVAPQVTGADGRYVFDNLRPGSYVVGFDTLPAGYVLTGQGAGADTAADSNPAGGLTSGKTAPITVHAVAGGTTREVEPGDGSLTALFIDPTVDAGIRLTPSYAVGDRVFLDTNGNGLQDGPDQPVPGITVTLLDGDGNPAVDIFGEPVPPVVTDADGNYLFDALPPGDYQVQFGDLPTGYEYVPTGVPGSNPANDSDAGPDGRTPVFTLGEGEPNMSPTTPADGLTAEAVNPTVDAGIKPSPTVAIGDYVYYDNNNNGVQDAGDQPAPGITVTLLDGAGDPAVDSFGNPVPPVVTGVDGRYVFDNLAPGDYIVVFSDVPAGYGFTDQQVADGTPATDSDPAGDGRTAVITVRPGEDNVTAVTAEDGELIAVHIDRTVDAGLVTRYAAGDVVWYDTNKNGLQDNVGQAGGEDPVAGVTVTLLNADGTAAVDADGTPVAPVVTGADGRYLFDNLLPGSYRVQFSTLPTGYMFTTPRVDGGDSRADSNPELDGLTPVFTVGVGQPNTRSVTEADGVTSGMWIDPTIDAGIHLSPAYAVGDVVFLDNNGNGVQDVADQPVPGVTVTLYTADGQPALDLVGNPVAPVVTDAGGNYLFDNLAAGSYYVTFTDIPAGHWFTEQSAGTDPAQDSNADADGRTLVFTLGEGAPNMRPTTADEGLAAVAVNTTIDAGITTVYAIGDYVWFDTGAGANTGNGIQDADETPVAGVTVTLYNADGTRAVDADGVTVPTATTDADGRYVFDNLLPGAYRVGFSDLPTGYRFTTPLAGAAGVDSDADTDGLSGVVEIGPIDPSRPNMRPVTGTDGTTRAVAIDPTVDAGIMLSDAFAIGDVVFYDDDRNGLQGEDEPGVPGITVTLLTPDGSPALDLVGNPVPPVVTGPNGEYLFDNLAEGSYIVEFSGLPDRYSFTPQHVGSDPAKDSDPDATGRTPVITIGNGVPGTEPVDPEAGLAAVGINPTVDAGIRTVLAVGDYVWYDVDKDGVQDADELPVRGVTVTLLNADGTPAVDADGTPVAPTSTDSLGHYVFDNLVAGSYRVQFSDIPQGYMFTTTGTGGGADSNADATGLTAVFTLSRTSADVRDVNPADGAALAARIDPTIDAGIHLAPAYAVGDTVWRDNNGNGIQDPGEPGVPGITVTLLNADGTPATTAVGAPVPPVLTDADGHYLFDNLAPGDYRVVFGDPEDGYVYTTPKVGSAEGDSDAGASGDPDSYPTGSGVFTLGPDADNSRPVDPDTDGDLVAVGINPTIDAGIVPLLAIGDYVFYDVNDRNGVQDDSEEPVVGITVTLLDGAGEPARDADGTVVAPTVTDARGHYVFDNLLPGSYQVVFSDLPQGWMFTEQTAGTDRTVDSDADTFGATAVFELVGQGPLMAPVAAGDGTTVAVEIDRTRDAGLVPAPQYGIGDLVFVDNNGNGIFDDGDEPLPGVTVTLLDENGDPATDAFGNPVPPQVTGPDGRYEFDQLPPGGYQVEFSDIPTGHEFTEPGAGTDPTVDSDPDATGRTPVIQIGPDAPGMVPATPSTDPLNTTVSVNPTVDAGVVPRLAIGDHVYYDSDRDGSQNVDDEGAPTELPVVGVLVTLLDGDGNPAVDFDGSPVAPVRTDADGHYVFDNLRPGSYQVVFTELPQGWIFTTQQAAGVATGEDSDADADGASPIFALSGNSDRVRPVTGTDGTSLAVLIDPTVDAGIIPAPAYAIGDYVWFDAGTPDDRTGSGNGVMDDGELPVVGLPVTLLNADGTPATDIFGRPLAPTVTDDQGRYVFDNLAPGEYIVEFGIPPTGYEFTPAEVAEATPDTDSNAGPDGRTPVITIGPDAPGTRPVVTEDGDLIAVGINPTIDAGLVPSKAYAVGDHVWIDNNGNGIQDGPDVPLAGVTVELLTADLQPAVDSFGNPVPAVVTDENGFYLFDNLAPGDYVVKMSDFPANHYVTGQFTGSDPAVDSNIDAEGLSAVFTLGADAENMRPVTDADGDLIAVAVNPTIDGGVVPLLALGDYVWFDDNRNGRQDDSERPVAGVTVTLQDGLGRTLAVTTTDADGRYLFESLSPGSYRVVFSDLPAGYVFTTTGDGSAAGVDSNAHANGMTSLITLVGGESGTMRAVTDDDGVTAGVWIDPTIDAGIVYASFAVGDHVWYDTNNNGVQDAGERPVVGVTVTLLDAKGKPVKAVDGTVVAPTRTDANGRYVFDNLPAGQYQVVFSDLPAGFVFTTRQVPGTPATVDSDALPSGSTGIFTLGLGEPQVRERNDLDGDLIAVWIDSTRDAGIIAEDLGLAPDTTVQPPLADTGVHLRTPLLAGLILLLAGAALALMGRRRRTEIG